MSEAGPAGCLRGRTALVTGASRGIGEAVARRLAAQGARVLALARTRADLERVVAAIREGGGAADLLVADLLDREGVAQGLGAWIDANGPVHVLVNDAGGNVRQGALDLPMATWDALLELLLTAPFRLARLCAPGMRAAGFGRIVNVASVAGLRALPTGAAYAAAKAGLIQLTRNLAREWGPWGITVNAVAPWYVRTALTERVLSDPAWREEVLRVTPVGRVGTAEEVAEAVAFLVAPGAAWITGACLPLDGGFTAAAFFPPG